MKTARVANEVKLLANLNILKININAAVGAKDKYIMLPKRVTQLGVWQYLILMPK